MKHAATTLLEEQTRTGFQVHSCLRAELQTVRTNK